MKKLFYIFLFLALSLISTAQSKFGVGLNLSGNSTWLINPQTYNSSNILDTKVKASWGMSYGLVFEYNFLQILDFEINFNYNIINQKYSLGTAELGTNLVTEPVGTFTSHRIIKYNTFDVPLLAKLKFGNLIYVEGGPLLHFVNKSSFVYDFDTEYYSLNREINVKKHFKTFGIGATLGFGVNIPIIPILPDKLRLNAGLRLNYLFTDMKGVNELCMTKEELKNFYPEDAKKFKTHPLYCGLKVSLIYRFNILKDD